MLELLLVARGFEDDPTEVMDGSDKFVEGKGNVVCIFQSKTVASRDPLTK